MAESKAVPQGRQKLVDFLTPEEREFAASHSYIQLRGSAGGWYQIDLDTVSENVHLLDGAGDPVVDYCVGIPPLLALDWQDVDVPNQLGQWKEACWIAQYLTIKYDEFGFLEEANEI